MRSYNFNMEKRERYGFRKYLGLGLCAVTLGAFFMTTTQPVKADTIPNVQTEQVQQEQNKGQPEEKEVQSNTEGTVEDTQGNADQESEPVAQDAQNNTHTQNANSGATEQENKQIEGADVQNNASPAEDAKEQQNNGGAVQDNQTTGTATENDAKQRNATQTESEQTKQTEKIDNQASQSTKKAMPAKADENVQKKVHVIYVDASSKVDDSFEQDALDDMTDYSSLPVMSEHDITNSSYDLDKIDKSASSITTDKVKALNDLYEEIGNLDNVNIPTNWKHALNDTQDYHLYSSKSSEITVNNVTTRTDNIYIPLIHQVRWLGRKGTVKGGNSMISVHYPDPKYGEDDLAFYSPIMVSETSGYSTDLVTGKTIPTRWTTSWFCESGDNVNKPFYIHGRLTDTDGHVSYDKGTITIPLYLYGQDLSDIYDLEFKRTDTNDNFITHFDKKNKTLTVQFNAKSYSDLTNSSGTMFFDGEIYFIPKEKQSHVIFYDDTEGGKRLDNDTYTITNKSSNGQINPVENPIDLSNVHVPEGYELKQGSSIPSQYVFKVNNVNGKWIADTTPIYVHLVHKIDNGQTETDTITRTITITRPDGTTDPASTTQSVTFTRTNGYDEVLGKTVNGEWNQKSATFNSITVPVIDGYTASSDVPELVVKPGDQNSEITITYSANPQSTHYEFVDDDENGAKVGEDTTVNGKTDQKVNLSITVPANYNVVGTLPTSYTFKAENNEPIVIHLTHQWSNISTPTTITRTIETTTPDGKTSDNIQSVVFNHNGKKDLVTGKTSYDSWDAPTKTFDAVNVNQIDGYYSLIGGTKGTSVSSETVTPDSKNSTIYVTYQAITSDKKQDPTPTSPKGEVDPTPEPDPEPEPTNNTDTPAPLPEQEPTSTVTTEQDDEVVAPKGQKAPEKKVNTPVKTVHKVNGPVKAEQNIAKTPAKATKFTSRMVKTSVKVTPEKHTASLPQTGEKDDLAIAAIGLTMASVGLLGLKKKKYVHDAN